MKRVLTILAIILLPLSVWAMTPINDSALSNVTGQAGVNINANLTMDIAIGTMAWGDSDGLSGVYNNYNNSGTTGGYVGINNFNITNLKIRARTQLADNYNGYSTLMLKPITIDVATGSQVAAGGVASQTFVRLGLGALEISMDSLQFDVSMGPRVGTGANAGTNTIALNENLGRVSLGGMDIFINPWSYVDIFSAQTAGVATDASGVCFAVNVTLDKFIMAYASWGDTDGFNHNVSVQNGELWMNNTSTGAGYIGLNDFQINGAISMNGTVQIDISTATSGIYAKLSSFQQYMRVNGGLDTSTEALNLSSLTLLFEGAHAGTAPANDAALWAWACGEYGTFVTGSTAIANELEITVPEIVKPTTVVHISFPTNFVVDVKGSIVGTVQLSDLGTFDKQAAVPTVLDTLGDIYIQGFKMTLKQGSWVDIWAH